jgi:hypothetical protein
MRDARSDGSISFIAKTDAVRVDPESHTNCGDGAKTRKGKTEKLRVDNADSRAANLTWTVSIFEMEVL